MFLFEEKFFPLIPRNIDFKPMIQGTLTYVDMDASRKELCPSHMVQNVHLIIMKFNNK